MYKDLFPTNDWAYFDNAATSPTSESVINSEYKYYEKMRANIHRSPHELGQEATNAYEKSRSIVAEFAGFDASECIFTRNTTESINLLAYSFCSDWGKDDVIYVPSCEHHSNMLPWIELQQRQGVKIYWLEYDNNGAIDLDNLHDVLKTTQTISKRKLLSIAHIGNVSGYEQSLEKISYFAKTFDCYLHVDAAQSIQYFTYPKADFVSFSAHKNFGPTGVGTLCVNQKLLEKMKPWQVGGGTVDRVTVGNAVYSEGVTKFEAGTPNIAGAMGFAESCNFINDIGRQKIKQYNKDIVTELNIIVKGLNCEPVNVDSTSICSFTCEYDAFDVASLLGSQKVAIRGGNLCAEPYTKRISKKGVIRTSVSIINDETDIKKFKLALQKTLDTLCKHTKKE